MDDLFSGSDADTTADDPDFTVVLAVDANTLEELKLTFPTWEKHKPSLLASPWIVAYDDRFVWPEDLEFLSSKVPDLDLFPWPPPWAGEIAYENQRWRMLSAFIHAPVHRCRTDWYLKLDTDAIATGRPSWIEPDWFQGDAVVVASPWSYTKPASAVEWFDQWGDRHADLKGHPRLMQRDDLRFEKRKDRVKHSRHRFTSWVAFARKDFTRRVSAMCPHFSLPCPTQDGLLWYCAERLRLPWQAVSFKKLGWAHRCTLDGIKEVVKESMAA